MVKTFTTVTYYDGESLVDERLYYKQYKIYEDLPAEAKNNQSRQEWEAYWETRKEEMT